MAELLNLAATPWSALGFVLLVFGFAPRFVLGLIVRTYPKSDPRRTELVAELYTIKRIERPLWVAEQLATVAWEGVPHRLQDIGRTLRNRRSTRKARRAGQHPATEVIIRQRRVIAHSDVGSRDDAKLAWDAFAELPHRWRTVLWHTVIEPRSPAEVGQLLGLTAHGVSALAYRAREGLREAYAQLYAASLPAGTITNGCHCQTCRRHLRQTRRRRMLTWFKRTR
ncbi:hypothetical protein PV458_09490 [Streptomyces sp. MN03-5084-2B]|nr:hypothetical protein [Streptomyces sp. MN03-5084-2B]